MSTQSAQPRYGRGYLLFLAGASVLYLLSVAPGVLWQDNGMVQVRVVQRDLRGAMGLALSHPLYYATAIAFQVLPFGESAFKTSLAAAVFGAVTVANVGLLIWLATGHRRGAIIGAIALAVAHTFWQHSAMAETYTLTAALLTSELLCLLQYTRTRRPGWLMLMLLANGLGISNHLLALLALFCYVGLFAYLIIRKQIGPVVLLSCIACWLLGSSLYLGLIAQHLAAGAGWRETAQSALLGGYASNVLNLTLTRRELFNTVMYLGLNFPTPLVLLFPVGLCWLWQPDRRLFAALLSTLLVIHLGYAMRYNIADQYTFFIPTIVLSAVIIGLGAEQVLAQRPKWNRVLMAAAVLPVFIYLPLPQLARAAGLKLGLTREVPFRNEYRYFLHPFKTGEHGPERFVEWLRSNLPANSVLIADGTTVRPVHYAQLTHRWRSDVTVFPSVDEPDRPTSQASVRESIEQGRAYVVTPKKGYCPKWLLDGYAFEPAGLIWKVAGPAKPTTSSAASPANPFSP